MTITQFLKNNMGKIKGLLDQDTGKLEVRPDSVWLFMVIIFCILVLCFAIFSFTVFTKISNSTLVDNGSNTLDTISREKLGVALNYLKTKDDKINYLKNNKPKIVDPSR